MGHLKYAPAPGPERRRSEPADSYPFPREAVTRIGRFARSTSDPLINGVEQTLDHMGRKLQELRLLLDPGDPDRPRAA